MLSPVKADIPLAWWWWGRFSLAVVGLIAATQFNVRLLRRYTPQQILVSALIAGTAAGLLLVMFAATGSILLAGMMLPAN